WLKNRLVRSLMRPRPAAPLRLTRQVVFGADQVTVTDELVAGNGLHVLECRREQKFAAIHMGSSRYFQWDELAAPLEPDADCAKALREHGRARVVRTWCASAARRDADG